MLLLATLGLFVPAPAFPASYTVKGILTSEGHGLGEQPGYKSQPREREFEVSVDDCKWAINMILVRNTNYDYFHSSFDGTNIIYVSKLNLESFDRFQRELRSRPNNNQTKLYRSSIIESGPVPRTLGSVANPYPWLAFASGCYFKELTNEIATDIYPSNPRASDFASRRDLPCNFTLSPLPPYLPMQIEFWWTNLTKMSAEGTIVNQPLPAPFKGKFLAARFKSEQFTDVNGLSLPTKFEMTEYRPLPTATSANDFRCTLIIRGSVTDISPLHRQWTNELLDGAFVVNDFRFSTNAPISRYVVSDGKIPPLDDTNLALAKQQAFRQLEARKKQESQEKRSKNRHLVLIPLAAVCIAPLIFLFWQRGKQ